MLMLPLETYCYWEGICLNHCCLPIIYNIIGNKGVRVSIIEEEEEEEGLRFSEYLWPDLT